MIRHDHEFIRGNIQVVVNKRIYEQMILYATINKKSLDCLIKKEMFGFDDSGGVSPVVASICGNS